MKQSKPSLNQKDLSILKETYNVDLSKPKSIKAFAKATRETSERILKIRREIFNSLYPHRKKRSPNGPECSFCLRRQNEVTAMAKHESGFNLCNECIKTLRRRDKE